MPVLIVKTRCGNRLQGKRPEAGGRKRASWRIFQRSNGGGRYVHLFRRVLRLKVRGRCTSRNFPPRYTRRGRHFRLSRRASKRRTCAEKMNVIAPPMLDEIFPNSPSLLRPRLPAGPCLPAISIIGLPRSRPAFSRYSCANADRQRKRPSSVCADTGQRRASAFRRGATKSTTASKSAR